MTRKKKEFITVARFRIFELEAPWMGSGSGRGEGLVPVGEFYDTFETEAEAEEALLQMARDSADREWITAGDIGIGSNYVILKVFEIRTTI